MPQTCDTLKAKQSRDKWRAANKDKIAKQAKEYAAKNKEKMREYRRIWKQSSAYKSWQKRYDRLPGTKERKKQWRVLNRIRNIDNELFKRGVPRGTYSMLMERQGGRCAICGAMEPGNAGRSRLHLDHDHVSGLARGLLCHFCNAGLGHFKDNPELLSSASKYLQQSRLTSLL